MQGPQFLPGFDELHRGSREVLDPDTTCFSIPRFSIPDKEGPLSDGEITMTADAFLKTLEPERV